MDIKYRIIVISKNNVLFIESIEAYVGLRQTGTILLLTPRMYRISTNSAVLQNKLSDSQQ